MLDKDVSRTESSKEIDFCVHEENVVVSKVSGELGLDLRFPNRQICCHLVFIICETIISIKRQEGLDESTPLATSSQVWLKSLKKLRTNTLDR